MDEQIYQQDPLPGDIPALARIAMDVETFLGSGVWHTYHFTGAQLANVGQFKDAAKNASYTKILPANARLERIDFSGTGTVKVGTTAGGEEIIFETDIVTLHSENLGKMFSKTATQTIYITIVSGIFDITIDYLPNRF